MEHSHVRCATALPFAYQHSGRALYVFFHGKQKTLEELNCQNIFAEVTCRCWQAFAVRKMYSEALFVI